MKSVSQMSQVSRITVWRSSLNVFVFVFIFVFVIVFLGVMSCLLITLIKCLKGHKSLGSLFEGILKMYLSFVISHHLCLCLFYFCSGHISSSLWSNVSKVTSLLGCSLRVFSKCLCHCHCLCICHCHCLCHFFWSGLVSSSLWLNGSKVISLY